MNLVLTGFMGTGKSTLGRLVATRLKRPFVDMDSVIEARAGQSIAALFATQGEAAFRAMERALCRELAAQEGLVIATGGGALVSAENRAVMQRTGIVICLTASPAVLAARLAQAPDRPLLAGDDPVSRLEDLLAMRAAAYAALPLHLDTTDLTPEQVMEAILTLWHTQTSST